MNTFRKFKGRNWFRRNPRFGTRIYIGAHRYVYYIDGRPQYYFSDRPYTLKDARTWKRNCLICYGVLAAVMSVSLFDLTPKRSGVEWILSDIIIAAFAIHAIYKIILLLTVNPEEDPMLRSFQCTDDFAKPSEAACQHCGYIGNSLRDGSSGRRNSGSTGTSE